MPFLALEFIVVGASIAGLTCASILAKAGHNVTVVEKKGPLVKERGAGGLRVPPSMARLLKSTFPDIAQSLQEKWLKCSGVEYRSDHVDLGADFYMITYYDLCSLLLRECEKYHVSVRYHSEVLSVTTSKEKASVVISTGGELLEADIIVGADGRNSIVRHVIVSQSGDAKNEEAASSLPLTEIISIPVPVSDMLQNELTAPLATSSAHGDNYILVLEKVRPRLANDEDRDYWEPINSQDLQASAEEYAPLLKKLIELSRIAHPSIQTFDDLNTFVGPHDKAIIIGDATKSSLINSSYSATLAMEDAFTLAHLFSTISDKSEISFLMTGYHEIRFARSKTAALDEMLALLATMMPPGPDRDLRDASMEKTLHIHEAPDEADADELAVRWSSWIRLCNYDAKDAVDEWWLNWGRHQAPLQGSS
ncbi:FAD/NAD(P)-binding domain-containing protein [Hymenopellis radicata]|nr:FAD/NAD(P)-binding domain-containing protein [Hymenopellis radicata]